MTTRVLISIIAYSVSVFIDIGVFLIESILKIDTVVVSSGVATSLMIFLIELLYEQYMANADNDSELRIRQLILIIFIPLGSIFIGMKSMNYSDENYFIESFILL